jgi:hypothetical protein
MVSIFSPSVFETIAFSILAGNNSVYQGVPREERELSVLMMKNLALIDADEHPTDKGKYYAAQLHRLYGEDLREGALPMLKSKFDFVFNGERSNGIGLLNHCDKPVVFAYHIPDYGTSAKAAIMLKLAISFPRLSRLEYDFLYLSLYDNDPLPNSYWIVRGKKGLMGNGNETLYGGIGSSHSFIQVFTGQFTAITLAGRPLAEGNLEVGMSFYVSNSNGAAYLDFINAFRQKLSQFLDLTRSSTSFEECISSAKTVEVNSSFKELEECMALRSKEEGPVEFKLKIQGVVEYNPIFAIDENIIQIIIEPPSSSKLFPWARWVSPWLVDHTHGTRKSDLKEGIEFYVHNFDYLELDDVVIISIMVSGGPKSFLETLATEDLNDDFLVTTDATEGLNEE